MPPTPISCRLPRVPFAVPLLAIAAAAACGGTATPAGPELREGDRVRFVAPGFSRQPLVGMIGLAGQCISVMVPDRLPAPRRFDVVPVDSLTVLEVDRTAEQVPDPRRLRQRAALGTPGKERWIPVSVAALKKRYGSCRPGE